MFVLCELHREMPFGSKDLYMFLDSVHLLDNRLLCLWQEINHSTISYTIMQFFDYDKRGASTDRRDYPHRSIFINR
jgi:hypothetical protein